MTSTQSQAQFEEAPTRAEERRQGSDEGRRTVRWIASVIPVALLAVATYLCLAQELNRMATGVVAILMLLLLMAMKVPIFAALCVPGLLGLYGALGPTAVELVLSKEAYRNIASWELSVVPMFIAMGLLLWQSGFTTKVYAAGRAWLHWLPGGLAVGTNIAGAGLASVSGGGLGTVFALGRIGIPEMLKAGYDKRLATASVLAASLAGGLIPPSIMMVIYAGIAEVPIGKQLLAGILPGLLIAFLACSSIVVMCLARPSLRGSDGDQVSKPGWTDRFRTLGPIWPLPVLVVVVLGGMYSGTFTATEAGAAGALGALVITVLLQRRNKPISKVLSAIGQSVVSVGAMFMMVIGAYIFARMMTVTGIAQSFTDWVVGLEMTRIEFLLMMFVAYLVMGTFMDPLAMMLLTVPLLIPSLEMMDISLMWYGVFAVFMGELAVITPPVGILTFVLHSITRDKAVNVGQNISLKDICVGMVWFLPMVLVFVLLLMLFPEIVEFIPNRSDAGG